MGAGAKHRLVFIDRLLATLVHLHLVITSSRDVMTRTRGAVI